MNNYVVMARFDKETDIKIMSLWKQIADLGCSVSECPPHITLAAYENFDEKLLCDYTSEFIAAQEDKIDVAFHSLSILPPGGEHSETAVLCLNPSHSKHFVDFYYKFHEKYEEYCTGIGWFNSIKHGSPVIHATLGIVLVKDLQKIMELVFCSEVFGKAEITALEVYSYPCKFVRRFCFA